MTDGERLAGAPLRPAAVRPTCFVIAAALFFGAPLAAPLAAADLSDPDTAVEAGREALSDHWDLPWYDAETDDFHTVTQKPPADEWDWDWLKWLFDFFSGWNFDFSTLLRVLLWLAVIGLIAWLIYVMIRAYRETELRSAEAVDAEEDGRAHIERVEALPVAVERKVDDLLAEARRLRSAGDLSLAVVYLFSHQLVELDKAHLVRLVKGKTNRQYLRELRRNTPGRPRLSATVNDTMLVFERAFFGAHPPAIERLDACFAAVEEFEREVAAAGEEEE